jgi:glycosyltransferase involved in cell wall biosynthesis
VALLPRYGPERASGRVRAYGLVPHLARAGVETRVLPFTDRTDLVGKARYAADALALASWADVVVLHKPPHPTWLIDALARVNPRAIVDLDDAVWAVPAAGGDPARHRELGRRLSHAIARAGFVTAGSEMLAAAVRRGFPRADVTVLPSSVDLDERDRTREHGPVDRPVVGWVGSPENLEDFAPALEALRDLDDRVRVRIVSSRPLDALPAAEFERWSADRATEAPLGFDVGVMPLRDDQRSRGRCGFKAIEYMAAGLPVVASDVGATREVVVDGETGFVVDGTDGWLARLGELADDRALRARMGAAGRRRVAERFSVQANLRRLLEVLERRAAT